MTIRIVRDQAHKMKHTVHVGRFTVPIDEPPAVGGEDEGDLRGERGLRAGAGGGRGGLHLQAS